MRKPIVVVGSINTDFVLQAPRLPVVGETISGARFQIFSGGKGANQAVAAARLGATTFFVGKVGKDSFGVRLRKQLRAAGVRVRYLFTDRRSASGIAFVVTDARGQNSIVVSPGANRRLRVADVRRCRQRLATVAIILVQLEIPLETVAYVVELAARRGIPLVLDAAPARRLPRRLLRRVSIITPNETEACVLCGLPPVRLSRSRAEQLCRRILALGPKTVILKMGGRGALVAERDGRCTHIPALKVKAVDSTAAGDAFNGGLAVALWEGRPLLDAVQFATTVGAFSVTRLGAQTSLPTRAELRRWLRGGGKA